MEIAAWEPQTNNMKEHGAILLSDFKKVCVRPETFGEKVLLHAIVSK